MRSRLLELTRFLSVGAVAFVVDLGLFNVLRFGPGRLLEDKPLTAKIIAVAVATLVSWLGNRHWTFSSHRTAHRGRELTLYAAINVLGVFIGIGTLAFTHYVLDLRTPLEDNISTVLGIVLGTIVRYIGYKKLVFTTRAPSTDLRTPDGTVRPARPAVGLGDGEVRPQA
ncbi:GtrA family protein [Cellulomonas cellasea]|uniref:GtrA family protein n=1 Tax=Cellulomonas cellasea TaxID=43670 RepID=UPI0025A3675B|nr:GtrA family protein [Cellulomonas cellasea]MDM8084665.1 GtrA family protein [Cellulomonas cellasea]